MPSCSIVVLNWNSHPVVMDAVRSAVGQTHSTVQVVIVDNGSTDGSLQALRNEFPNVKYVPLETNTGFAVGMNTGIAASSGEFVVLQNADLILDPDYVAKSITYLAQHPGVAAVGGRVNRLKEARRTDDLDACGYVLSRTIRSRLVQPDLAGRVLGVSGSCPVFRRSALTAVSEATGHIFDPWYFAYYEDIDLMLRLNLRGFEIHQVPTLQAWHVRSLSTGARARFYNKPIPVLRHHIKNRLATIIRSVPRTELTRLIPSLIGAELVLPFYLALRRPRALGAWLGAWLDVLHRPQLKQQRQAIMRAARPDAIQGLRPLIR